MVGAAMNVAPFECNVCDKSFGRRDLRDRHRRRCERTYFRPRKSKRKSCFTCAASKVACDLRQPSCSRCAFRDIFCQYDASQTSRVSQPRTPLMEVLGRSSTVGRPAIASVLPGPSLSISSTANEVHHPLEGSTMHPLRGIESTNTQTPVLSVDSQVHPATDIISISTMSQSSSSRPKTDRATDSRREAWTDSLGTGNDDLQALFTYPDHNQMREVADSFIPAIPNDTCLGIDLLASFGIPTAVSTTVQSAVSSTTQFESLPWHPPLPWDGHTRSSIQASSDKGAPTTLARYHRPILQWNSSILDSVTTIGNDDDWVKLVYSYPQLMLKVGTYPPFVHHTIYRCSEGEVLEPLAIAFCCLGAYNASMPTSRDFTYSLINKEREQLVANFPQTCASMSEISVLASVHAMCIYQIVGFFGSNFDQATNAELQQPRLLKMTRHLARTHFSHKPDEHSTWEAWAVNETIRRTIFLVNAINCLSSRVGRQSPIFYEPLDNDLLSSLTPPAPTCLWKAKSASEWENEKLFMKEDDQRLLETTLGEFLYATMSGYTADTQPYDGIELASEVVAFEDLGQFTRLVLATLRNTLG